MAAAGVPEAAASNNSEMEAMKRELAEAKKEIERFKVMKELEAAKAEIAKLKAAHSGK